MMKSLVVLGMVAFGTAACTVGTGTGIDDKASAGFCSTLSGADGESVRLYLLVGEGLDQVVISADSGACSGTVGGECSAVPAGENIPVILAADADGDHVYLRTEMDFDEDRAYVIDAIADADSDPALNKIEIDAESCSVMECALGYYTPRTCDAEDVCKWVGDDHCDDACKDIADDPLDDSEDCSGPDGGDDTDTGTDTEPGDTDPDGGTDGDTDTDTDTDTDADTDTDTDADTDTDTDADTDTDTDPSGAEAYASFCHGISGEGGVDRLLDLMVAPEQSQAADLISSSFGCSSEFGGSCAAVAAGEEVPVYVVDVETGDFLYSDVVTLEAGAFVMFEASLDAEDNVALAVYNLADDGECGLLECDLGYINANTCDPDDFCSWAENDFCDDICLDTAVTEMFDDSVDCAQ